MKKRWYFDVLLERGLTSWVTVEILLQLREFFYVGRMFFMSYLVKEQFINGVQCKNVNGGHITAIIRTLMKINAIIQPNDRDFFTARAKVKASKAAENTSLKIDPVWVLLDKIVSFIREEAMKRVKKDNSTRVQVQRDGNSDDHYTLKKNRPLQILGFQEFLGQLNSMGNEEEGLPTRKETRVGASSSNTIDPTVQMVGSSTEITEDNPEGQHRRHRELSLEISSRSLEDARCDFVRTQTPPIRSPTPKRVNFSPMPSPSFSQMNEPSDPSSSKIKSNIRSLLPKLSFKYRNSTLDIEKAAMLALGGSSETTKQKPFISRTLSLTKLFTLRTKKTSSLPVTPIAHSNPESMHGGSIINPPSSVKRPIHRSRSVPVISKDGSVRQLESLGGLFRVVPSTPRAAEGAVPIMRTSYASPTNDSDGNDDGGEDIPEEEAVCRICLIELGEGADTLKMECSCRGELALAHQECAVKWFSVKGNRTCDVCKQEVKNLPVTLFRVQNSQALDSRGDQTRHAEDVPVLVIVSMLAYFCFLEQLLVGKMGSGAIAISLPFSCILGLLASMTSTTMGRADLVSLHMQAVLCVLLATFTGFGATMFGNSVIVEMMRWRRRWLAQSNEQRGSLDLAQPQQQPATVNETQSDHILPALTLRISTVEKEMNSHTSKFKSYSN
ncbi:unnamed protein product [Dovyalis caffra]|uniref:RING-CH-type domain-containing protein n=1 Tax=Dovyalis caffra TaxID=77055 RepID=A0AAV1S089_9ROSI|nr:unnamed protein product [Dovyalis caffra]